MIEQLYDYISQQLTDNQFAIAGILSAVFYAILNYAKIIPGTLWERFVRQFKYVITVEQSDPLYVYLSEYIATQHPKKMRNVEYGVTRFNYGYEHDDDDDDDEEESIDSNTSEDKSKEGIIKKHHEDYFYIFKDLRLIKISKERIKLENANSFAQAFMGKLVVSGLFSEAAIEDIIFKANLARLNELQNKNNDVIKKYDWDGYNWSVSDFPVFKRMENMYVDGKEEIIKDVEKFIANTKWYIKRGIIPKRGYFFDGEAGTGKTQFAFAMANHINWPIHIMNIDTMSPDQFARATKRVRSKSVVLLDDGDIGTENRATGESATTKSKTISLSSLLSFLDGADSPSNVIFVLTTNYPDKFDAAFVRDGRFHFWKTFKTPSHQLRLQYLKDWYEMDQLPENVPNIEMKISKLENLCLQSETLEEVIEKMENMYAIKSLLLDA